jgi:hypothetical protein
MDECGVPPRSHDRRKKGSTKKEDGYMEKNALIGLEDLGQSVWLIISAAILLTTDAG